MAITTGLFGALITGASLYIKLGRSILTRNEHDKECARNTGPIRKDISEIKECTLRLEKKQDDSTKDLGDKMQKILIKLVDLSYK